MPLILIKFATIGYIFAAFLSASCNAKSSLSGECTNGESTSDCTSSQAPSGIDQPNSNPPTQPITQQEAADALLEIETYADSVSAAIVDSSQIDKATVQAQKAELDAQKQELEELKEQLRDQEELLAQIDELLAKVEELLTEVTALEEQLIAAENAPVATAANSSISVSAASAVADGTTAIVVTITIKDQNSQPMSGLTPVIAATGSGNTVGTCSVTDANGVSTCNPGLTSTTAETKSISLAEPIVLAGPSVEFTEVPTASASNSSIAVSGSAYAVADGSGSVAVTVTIKDQFNNPMSGVTPVIAATGSNNTVGTCTATDTSGVSTCNPGLRSTTAETKTLSLTSPIALSGPSVYFYLDSFASTGAATFAAGSSSGLTESGGTISLATRSNSERQFNNAAADLINTANIGLYYPMEDTLADQLTGSLDIEDLSGNDNDGSFNGAAGSYANTGLVGNALLFDGVDDKVTISMGTGLSGELGTSFTLYAWIKKNGVCQDNGSKIFDFYPGTTRTILQCWSGDGLDGEMNHGGYNYIWGSKKTIDDGNWHQVAIVKDNSYQYIYADGQLLRGEDGSFSNVAMSQGSFTIGGRDSTRFVDGLLDEVAIITEALDQEDIYALYQRQKSATSLDLGTVESEIFDSKHNSGIDWTSISWNPTAPFGKPIPDSGNDESLYASKGLSSGLLDNIVGLFHFDGTSALSDSDAYSQDRGTAISLIASDGNASGVNYGQSRINQGLIFDGTDDYLQASASVADYRLSGDFGISFWVKPDSLKDSLILGHMGLSESEADNALFYIRTIVGPGSPSNTSITVGHEYGAAGTNEENNFAFSCALRQGAWHHIVVNKDATAKTWTLYMDNHICAGAHTYMNETTGGSTGVLRIAKGEGAGYFDGSIDELVISSSQISTSDIEALYHRGATSLKFQVRGCAVSDCTGAGSFVGPDGTNSSYFSEGLNNSGAKPSFDISGAGVSGRYIQYKAFIQTYDSDYNPGFDSVTISE